MRLEDWRTLVVLLCAAAALIGLTAVRHGRTDVAATAHVHVADPIDGWLGDVGSLDGDLSLARRVAPDAQIDLSDDSLVFTTAGDDSRGAQSALAEALASYEAARLALRAGLDERLEMIEVISSVSQSRTGTSTTPGVDLVSLGATWSVTPMDQRLGLIDDVVDQAFWDVASTTRGVAALRAAAPQT